MTGARLSLAPSTVDMDGLPLDGVQGFLWHIQTAAAPRVPVDLTGRAAQLVLYPGARHEQVLPLTGGVDGALRWVPPRTWRGPAPYVLLLADAPGGLPRAICQGTLTHGLVVTGG